MENNLTGRNYYIIGTKYGLHATEDRYPDMRNCSVVATDFGMEGMSLSQFYLQDNRAALENYLLKHQCQDKNIRHSAFILNTFLNIRAGDIVALKSSGNPVRGKGRLGICAYAVVIEKDGIVYHFDSSLGHCLHVVFLEKDIQINIAQGGYFKAVQKVSEEKIAIIFEKWRDLKDQYVASLIFQPKDFRRGRKGVDKLSDSLTGNRKGTDATIINYKHKTIQQELFDYLKIAPDAEVIMEENFTDIRRWSKDGSWVELYEVKPFGSASACIRDSLGQLLDYATRENHTIPLKLIVIGPVPASEEDQIFIKFISSNIKLSFEYKAWKHDFEVNSC